jgi:prepilin-type N-terminal cleavage/methylation domain-containing protein
VTRNRRTSARPAFTLLELLLVLAMVCVVVALTMPALALPLDNHRLRRGADQIRARWAQARASAMEHGRTYVFRYEPASDAFSVEPWMSGDDYLESDQLVTLGVTAGGDGLAEQTALAAKLDRLPDNIVFLASETTADIRAALVANSSSAQAATAQTNAPIFFYPDGTTSTARLIIANQRDRFVTLTMRGLTGVVEVSGLQIREELQP